MILVKHFLDPFIGVVADVPVDAGAAAKPTRSIRVYRVGLAVVMVVADIAIVGIERVHVWPFLFERERSF